jgi:5-methylthioadenosine/S-adenosylhomocysteine deaminase
MGGRGVAYQEVFGPHPDQLEASFSGLVAAVERLLAEASGSVRVGISPHAPYTVSEALFRRVTAYARRLGLPMAIHLAESRAETELVTGGHGRFADAWRARGIPPPTPARSVVTFFDRLDVLGPDLLAIHAVQVDGDDVAALARSGARVALCPRSNLRHGHGAPPIAALLEAGLACGLGSDSVASVDTPDLFAEARTAIELGGLSAERAIGLITREPARALGLADEIGSLEPGKWADLCLIHLDAVDPPTLVRRVVAARPGDVRGTCVAGRLVFGHWDRLAAPVTGDPQTEVVSA